MFAILGEVSFKFEVHQLLVHREQVMAGAGIDQLQTVYFHQIFVLFEQLSLVTEPFEIGTIELHVNFILIYCLELKIVITFQYLLTLPDGMLFCYFFD